MIHTCDQQLADILALCRLIGVQLRVRGTDERPVILCTDPWSKREVGGSELHRRMEAL